MRLKGGRKMVIALVVTMHVVGFLSSIHAVMSTRTSQGAIAWAVSLNTFPYIAVPAYWILGRSRFRGYVTARKAGELEIEPMVHSVEATMEQLRTQGLRTGAVRAAEELAEIPTLRGNRVELLIDGEATFESIFDGIDKVERYVLVQFFIVEDDDLGRRLQERLIARAREGVRVYFLYDEVGSHDLPGSYLRALRKAGVEIYDFHTRQGPHNRFQINFRNHRKVVVVDGRTAWVGATTSVMRTSARARSATGGTRTSGSMDPQLSPRSSPSWRIGTGRRAGFCSWTGLQHKWPAMA